MRKSTIFSSGFAGRQISKMLGLGIAGLFSFSVASAQLSAGNYYIDGNQPSGGNSYQSFAAFFTALSNAGNAIASPGITLNVVPQSGGYNEQFTIPSISGLGPIQGGESRLIIKGDGTANTRIHYAASASTNAYSVVFLDQADYITFDSLIIENTASSGYNFALRLYLSSDRINVTNCHLKVRAGSFNSGYAFPLNTTGTTSTSYTTGNANNPDNLYVDNTIFDGGYYGAAVNGGSSSSGSWPTDISISNSTFQNYYYMGIYSRYWDGNTIHNNFFDGSYYSGFTYEMYLYYQNNLQVTSNVISSAGYYPILAYYVNYYNTGTVSGRAVIANNSVLGNFDYGSCYGMLLNYLRSTDVVYNSLYLAGSTMTTAYGMGIRYCDNTVMVKNNVIREEATSTRYADYSYNNTGMSGANYDYNTFYTENTSGLTYYWNFTTYSGLSAFQSGSGTNSNSQEADPSFVSSTDLHVNGASLYGQGTPITGVTVDYDGNVRSATAPSHGIHEFVPPQNDAGVTAFANPVAVCADTGIVVSVTVRNFGIQTLTSFDLDWSWSGNTGSNSGSVSVSNAGLATGDDTTIQITTISMTAGAPGYTFQAYTSSPNSVNDENYDNDTSNYYTQTAMEGAYTIGGTTPDFVTFNDAISAMQTYGVCDHVTFHARAGTYTERLNFNAISGLSSNSTVTFTVDTNNTGAVKIEYTSGSSSDEGVMRFENISYITIDGYDIENKGSSYAYGIVMRNDVTNVTISNNNVWNNSTSSLSNPIYVYTYGFSGENIHVLNNTFAGGYYGGYFYGYDGSGPGMNNLRVEGNTFENAYYYGLYASYHKNSTFKDNVVDMVGGNSYSLYSYGMMIYGYGTGYEVTGNRIHAGYYGLFLSSISGTSQNYGIVANNKAMIGDTTLGFTIGYYAMYLSNSGFLHVAHNLALSQTTNGYTAYFNGGLMEVYNNIFARVNSGSVMFISGSFSVTAADNNAYLELNGASNGLSYMQGLGYDANGVELDSATYANLDSLFTCTDSLVGRGMPLAQVPMDIDGSGRSQTAPTIGPHEYVSAGNFDLGDDMKICAGDTVTLGSNIAGATFSWSTGAITGTIDVTAPGTYSVTITSGCGTANGSINIEDGSSVADWSSVASWLTHSFTNTSSNGTSYMWDFGDGKTSTDMNPVHLYADTGWYEVCLTTYGDCDDDTKCAMVRAWNGVGIGEFDASKAISMYPNPATDVLVIEASDVPGNVMTIEVSSISGQIVMSDRLNDFNGYAKEQMDISVLTQGVYFVKIFTNEVATTKRLVVKK